MNPNNIIPDRPKMDDASLDLFRMCMGREPTEEEIKYVSEFGIDVFLEFGKYGW